MIPFADDDRPRAVAVAVWTIIAGNAYGFYLELTARSPAYFINAFALVPYNFTHGIQLPSPSPHPYVLTLITSMFLHGGFAHIFFNMLFLAVFGPRMERHFGHLLFLAVYTVCGLAGGIGQLLADPASHVPEIGASGAIAGILGAYIVTYPGSRIGTVTPIGCFPLFLRLPAVVVIGIWAALQFFMGVETFDPHANQGGTAYFAHIGGFSCGAIVGGWYALTSGRNRSSRPRRRR